LVESGVLEKCQITSVEETTSSHPGSRRIPSFNVTYTLNSDSAHVAYKVDCYADFMYSGKETRKYKGKNFDVILMKEYPHMNQILLSPEDYEHFRKEIPDSMTWIINYIKGWQRTSHGLLQY
ncbi:MAG: hypothetical protein M3R27_14260, partial [Bacteroidota bacterium]|nr:hypothetical protein [Bacteroidota bacterium]